MRLYKCYAALIVLLLSVSASFSEDKVALDAGGNIKAYFSFNIEGELSLNLENSSNREVQILTDVDYMIQFGLAGFPQNAAIQLRSIDEGKLLSEGLAGDGWVNVDIYKSRIDLSGLFGTEKIDPFSPVNVGSDSVTTRPVDYYTGARFATKNREDPLEFRVKWKVRVKEAGEVTAKLVMSEWYPCAALGRL